MTKGSFCFLSVKLKILPIHTLIGYFFNFFNNNFSANILVFPYLLAGSNFDFSEIFLNFFNGL